LCGAHVRSGCCDAACGCRAATRRPRRAGSQAGAASSERAGIAAAHRGMERRSATFGLFVRYTIV